MQTKLERAAIDSIFCDVLVEWESRMISLSERTNDDGELNSRSDMIERLRALRGHAEVLVDYLRDKPTYSIARELIVKTGRPS